MDSYYLVADIGGTKSELAVYTQNQDPRSYLLKERFVTSEYDSLEGLIAYFLLEHELKIEAAALAIAGPVINGRVTLFSSNLPWEVDETLLREKLQIPEIEIINDLKAVAGAIPHLKEEDLYTINKGEERAHETLAVIAPGTGLGEAFLIWDGAGYKPCISEGAHVNFGPRTDLEIGLLNHMKKRQNHVTYESVCSGLGIHSIYEYLVTTSVKKEESSILNELGAAEDLTRAIINMAGQKGATGGIAVEVLQLFASILGAEAGNLVLKTMATGGLFLAGGIPPRIIPYLDSQTFLDSFLDKGVMAEMMPDVPIHIITNPDTAIIGAAAHLFNKR
jgi:glucokinase